MPDLTYGQPLTTVSGNVLGVFRETLALIALSPAPSIFSKHSQWKFICSNDQELVLNVIKAVNAAVGTYPFPMKDSYLGCIQTITLDNARMTATAASHGNIL